jgi:hypothetical protein
MFARYVNHIFQERQWQQQQVAPQSLATSSASFFAATTAAATSSRCCEVAKHTTCGRKSFGLAVNATCFPGGTQGYPAQLESF